ncbi:MAG: DNA-directed RNA polymerase subunit beta', partial [Clostridia bacterium]|nr:DNA-directed RNA polymerase subunit beta' [Clostridia bacterium]
AKRMVERVKPEVWDVLEEVIKEHPVLLNRAPTLHRLGIQAFEPVLVEGKALKLHPLVCTAYNADFDGDQMAVHVPLSAEAQAEARFLMLAANNLLKPSDGKPVAVPTQDMVLGSYYLTLVRDDEPGVGKVFRNKEEAVMAYENNVVGLHAPIKVRVSGEVNGETVTRLIDATVGYLIFNESIPQNLGFTDRSVPGHELDLEIHFDVNEDGTYKANKAGKKLLGKIVDACIRINGTAITAEVLDNIKATGYKYSTKGAITIAVSDAIIPPIKAQKIAEAEEQVDKVNKMFRRGMLSANEKSKKVQEIWEETVNDVSAALTENLQEYNPINMMVDSGARGSVSQIRQLAGMRGLIANTSGKIIEVPIRSNYREGLNVQEYFISSRGARKGLADTALRTADSGYLTRRLVDISQDVIIREDDCKSDEGLLVYGIYEGKQLIEPLADRLIGRYLKDPVYHPETNELLMGTEDMISYDDAMRIVDAGVKECVIRSIITCKAKKGICKKCYGVNLATGTPVAVGEAVGIVAAQSIGEPGTQLTMRTFHTGGIASSEDITQGLPRVEELFEARRPKHSAYLTEIAGIVRIENIKKNKEIVVTDVNGTDEKRYSIPYDYRILVDDGDTVEKGQQITDGVIYPQDILAILGEHAVQNYIIEQVQSVYRLQGVDINDKHIEVIVRQMMRKRRVTDNGSSANLIAFMTLTAPELGERQIKRGDEIITVACGFPTTVTPAIQYGAVP